MPGTSSYSPPSAPHARLSLSCRALEVTTFPSSTILPVANTTVGDASLRTLAGRGSGAKSHRGLQGRAGPNAGRDLTPQASFPKRSTIMQRAHVSSQGWRFNDPSPTSHHPTVQAAG